MMRAAAVLLAAVLACGCDRPAAAPASRPAHPTIASLAPAATETLLAIGAGEQIVAVSNYESAPAVRDRPRVGDYMSTDWEALSRLRPSAMIIQMAPDRVPQGLKHRASALGIDLVNVRIERLDDVFSLCRDMGRLSGRADPAARLAADLRGRFEAIRARRAGSPPLRALIVRDAAGTEAIGPDTFLDDVLSALNLQNVCAGMGRRYPSVDREAVAAFAPDVVFVLIPGAADAVVHQAGATWRTLPDLPATKRNQVYILRQNYALVPGPRLADLAQDMSDLLQNKGIVP